MFFEIVSHTLVKGHLFSHLYSPVDRLYIVYRFEVAYTNSQNKLGCVCVCGGGGCLTNDRLKDYATLAWVT